MVTHDVLFTKLQASQLPDYTQALNQVDLDTYTYPDRLLLLTTLLNTIMQRGLSAEYLEVTLQHWTGDDDDYAATVGDLFAFVGCSNAILKYVCEHLKDIIPVEIVESQLTINNGLSFGFVLDRVERIFGSDVLGPTEYDFLRSQATQLEVTSVVTWFQDRAAKTTQWAVLPPWVSRLPTESVELLDLSRWRLVSDTLPPNPPDLIVDDLTSKYAITDADGEIVEQGQLLEFIDAAKSLAEPPPLDYPGDPLRMFGPINARTVPCPTGVIAECGCQMLTCICREFDQALDVDPEINAPADSWFTGACDGCHLRIRNASHALRYPILGGGWVGCFCSIDCLKRHRPRDASPIGELILDTVFETLERHGVLDRTAFDAALPTPVQADDFRPSGAIYSVSNVSRPPTTLFELLAARVAPVAPS
jgi:hypothetical protein